MPATAAAGYVAGGAEGAGCGSGCVAACTWSGGGVEARGWGVIGGGIPSSAVDCPSGLSSLLGMTARTELGGVCRPAPSVGDQTDAISCLGARCPTRPKPAARAPDQLPPPNAVATTAFVSVPGRPSVFVAGAGVLLSARGTKHHNLLACCRCRYGISTMESWYYTTRIILYR